jgi:hypothetical protein
MVDLRGRSTRVFPGNTCFIGWPKGEEPWESGITGRKTPYSAIPTWVGSTPAAVAVTAAVAVAVAVTAFRQVTVDSQDGCRYTVISAAV